jgi:BolA protein
MTREHQGAIQKLIEDRLRSVFRSAEHIDVVNESGQHAVPPGSETHFKVVIVAEAFATMKRLDRHRAVQDAVGQDIQALIKALSVRPLLPSEWKQDSSVLPSPGCHGGGH